MKQTDMQNSKPTKRSEGPLKPVEGCNCRRNETVFGIGCTYVCGA
jgi:hypothetical protein